MGTVISALAAIFAVVSPRRLEGVRGFPLLEVAKLLRLHFAGDGGIDAHLNLTISAKISCAFW